MKYEELLKYVYAIKQMETIVYEEQAAINKLTETSNSLGYKNNIYAPQKSYTEFNFKEYYPAYAGIVGVIAAIIAFTRYYENEGFWDIISSAVPSVIWGIIIGAVGGLIVGLIFSVLGWTIRKIWDSSHYHKHKSDYKKAVKEDDHRVAEELTLKQNILSEIELLKAKHADSMKKLNYYYSFNIIDQAYRHDMVAIYMFYQYLRSKQTYTLSRDNSTGDVGAYRLYQNDIMMGMIISKLDIIIEKLDEIAVNQNDIKAAIYGVNENINRLNDTVVKTGNRIVNEIRDQTAVQTYNAQILKREIELGNLINWLNYVDNTKR